ncbi:MAG: hypothetical protein JWO78_1627 [Micavibrio sp.]|nr:hypothetical protein [Micavibrio sp.]
MISRAFNYASMHPVKTAAIGLGVKLATPFILPYLAPVLVAPAIALAGIFAPVAMCLGLGYLAVHAVRGIGPTFNAASSNSGKILAAGIGAKLAAPFAAPLLGSTLGVPLAVALGGIFAPVAIVGGGLLLGGALVNHGVNSLRRAGQNYNTAPHAPAQA